MSSQVSYEGDRQESIFYFRTLRLLWLDCCYPLNPASLGPECSRYQQVHVILSTNRFGHIELRPKTPQRYPPLSLSVIGKCLSLPLGVCLPDTCPAWPSFSLIPSVSMETREGHRPILMRDSLPAGCLCQQFGTDSRPSSIHSLLPDPRGKGNASPPQTDALICVPINHSKLMPGQTTRHGTVTAQCVNLQRY